MRAMAMPLMARLSDSVPPEVKITSSGRAPNAAANDAEVKSETVGSYSRTLATGGESAFSALNATDGAKKLLAETCMEYLAHTGLLYRGGVYRCTLPTL